MRKIRLDLEALDVESFDTSGGEDEKGTVMANEATLAYTCQTLSEDLNCSPICSGSCTPAVGSCYRCYTESGGWPMCY